MQEQVLINRGLDQQEARIVVFISRKRMADITVIAHSVRMPTDRCSLVVAELVRKGIHHRGVGSTGAPVYSLSRYFSGALREAEQDGNNSPFVKKLFPVVNKTIKLPPR